MNEYNSVVIDGRQVIGGYRGLTISEDMVREVNSTPSNSVVDLSLKCIPELGLRNMYGILSGKRNNLVNFSFNKSESDILFGGNIEIKYLGDKYYSYVIDFDSAFCRVTYVCRGKTLTFFSDRFSETDLSYDGFKEKMLRVLEVISNDMKSRELDECEISGIFDVIFSREKEILSYMSELVNNVSSDDRQVMKAFLKNYGNISDKGRVLSEA